MTRKTGILLVFGLLIAGLGARLVLTSGMSPREQIESMRLRLREQRFAVNTCLSDMGSDQLAVERRLAGTDSLRNRITALESLDPRGVPRDSFPTYMELVEAFNRAVAAWDTLGTEAQSQREDCAALAERHNQLRDSLRATLAEEGLLPDSSLGPQ